MANVKLLPQDSTDLRSIYLHRIFHQLLWKLPWKSIFFHGSFHGRRRNNISTSIENSSEAGGSRFTSMQVSGSFHGSTWFSVVRRSGSFHRSHQMKLPRILFRASFHGLSYIPIYCYLFPRVLQTSSCFHKTNPNTNSNQNPNPKLELPS